MTVTTRSCVSVVAPGSVADLLSRASDGDPVAWDELLRRYGELVSATVRSFRLQDADVLDAVQMTWLRLAENVHRVQLPDRLGGWLTTTARRECLRILRRAHSAPNLCHPTPDTVADHATSPEQQIINADTRQTLWKIVAELSPRHRVVLRTLFTDHPRPTLSSPARPTSRRAGSAPPGRGPCANLKSDSTTTA